MSDANKFEEIAERILDHIRYDDDTVLKAGEKTWAEQLFEAHQAEVRAARREEVQALDDKFNQFDAEGLLTPNAVLVNLGDRLAQLREPEEG